MYFGSDTIIKKRQDYLMPCLNYFYQNPPQFVRGEMQYLYDDKGEKYLDFFAGVSVMNCGHTNPFIIDRMIEQLRSLQHVTNIYLTQPIVELAEKLADFLPGGLNNSFFCNSGSEANDGATLLARAVTKKRKIIALSGGLHGRTYITMSETHIPMWRADPFLSDDVDFISNTFADDGNIELAAQQSIEDLMRTLKNSDDYAAFITEPIQGNAGIVTPPLWYFKEVKKLLSEHGVLFIADEVQTGFARTGKNFAIEHYGVTPDIISISKAFGNGTPLAAFVTTKEIASKFTSPSASTLGGNPVSCAAGLAVIDYINENNLTKRAEQLGNQLFDKLSVLKEKYSSIRDVRGIGLMLGVELRSTQNVPLPKETDFILEFLKDKNIILGKNGIHRNVLAFQPPLVINESDIDNIVDVLDCALGAL